jgi:hypothetical protein
VTEFDQKGQIVQRDQYNAGGNITIHSPKAAWTPPLMLPPRAQSFVGRDKDLAWLLQQLTGEAGMTLALCGPGAWARLLWLLRP